jgi:hypothetical protein
MHLRTSRWGESGRGYREAKKRLLCSTHGREIRGLGGGILRRECPLLGVTVMILMRCSWTPCSACRDLVTTSFPPPKRR